MNIGTLIKSIRDSSLLVKSYSRSRTFSPKFLLEEYQINYPNTIEISLNTDDSIKEQFADPILVDYIEPNPVCTCT